jgi:hypothetical protein
VRRVCLRTTLTVIIQHEASGLKGRRGNSSVRTAGSDVVRGTLTPRAQVNMKLRNLLSRFEKSGKL